MELELTGFAPGGKAVAHAPDGRVVFVEYGIPGERVVARVKQVHNSYLEASVIQVLEPSSKRVESRCQYFGRCGGCQLQHIEYDEQLRLKTDIVREQLIRLGGFEDPPLLEMIGMSDPWSYRNHMRFTVRKEGYVGFMQRGTHRFLRIEHCEIALGRVNDTLHQVQDVTTGTRQITIRVGEQASEQGTSLLVQPTLQWRSRQKRSVPSGQEWYKEHLAGREFRISSAAFFQVNTRQAELLVNLVIKRVTAIDPQVVVDAYSGVGTFAALLAEKVPEVIAIEESVAAGVDSEINLEGLSNVKMLVGSAEVLLPEIDPMPDVVVIDPPRVGITAEVSDAILMSRARRLVYVSCDPATLARDLRRLVDGGFELVDVQPLDMFPQTQHIECVATLDRATRVRDDE